MIEEKFIDVSYDEDNGVRLGTIVRSIRRHWLLCLLVTVAMGFAAYAFTTMMVKPSYESSYVVYVSNRPPLENPDEDSQTTYPLSYLSNSDIEAEVSLAHTYAYVFQSDEYLTQLAQQQETDVNDAWTRSDVRISTETEQRMPLVTVTVTANSPQTAFDVANALMDGMPAYMEDIVSESSMFVVVRPQLNDKAVSPSLALSTALGLLGGFVITALIVVIVDGRNTSVKDRKDLEEWFGPALFIDAHAALPALPRSTTRVVGVLDADGTGLAANTVVDMARASAREGVHLLLMDCDAKEAAVCRVLGEPPERGLSDLLRNDTAIVNAVRQLSDGFAFLAPGSLPIDLARPNHLARPNQREHMSALLKELSEAYDLVLMYIPSTRSSGSSLVLADCASSVLLPVRMGTTRKPALAEALRLLEFAGVKVAGFLC